MLSVKVATETMVSHLTANRDELTVCDAPLHWDETKPLLAAHRDTVRRRKRNLVSPPAVLENLNQVILRCRFGGEDKKLIKI